MKFKSSAALLAGFSLLGTALAGKLGRSTDQQSIANERAQQDQQFSDQQEQLASLQTQAEISNNVSSLAALNAHASEIAQSWCTASLATEKERQQRLEKLIDSRAPDLERLAAREARAAELSYSKLVTSACKLQQQEIGHGLGQDLAAIQLHSEASANDGEAARTQKAAAKAESKDDKDAFLSYMASLDSLSEKGVQTDSTEDDETEGDEEEQGDDDDDASKRPTQYAPAASRATKTDKKLTNAAAEIKNTSGAKVPMSFLQFSNRHRLKQMSLNKMLQLLKSQPTAKQAKKWCHAFESKGTVAPLKNARNSLDAEQAKLEGLKVLQLTQKKEFKFRTRFARFWQEDTKSLTSLLQEFDNSGCVWAAKTHALHSASDRKAAEAAKARFGTVSASLQKALASRQQSLKIQEKHMSDLEETIAGTSERREKQVVAINKAEGKLKKVQGQISSIMDVCSEMKREGSKLLLKGITAL